MKKTIGIVATVVLLAAVIAVAVWQGSRPPAVPADPTTPAPNLTVVHGLIGSEKRPYFDDPKVKQAFADAGYDVRVDTAGSVAQLSADPAKYDFFFPGSSPVATELAARTKGKSFAPFYSPLVVYTWTDIAQLLRDNGLVTDAAGVPTLDIAAYEKLVQGGKRWVDLTGADKVYPATKSILITTTNPATSNSALMFASLSAYVANGNRVVTTQAEVDKAAPLIRGLFVDQGFKESSSEGPFESYLASGKGMVPAVVGYESQLLARQIARDPALTDTMTVLYPGPGMMTKHTLVATKPAGEAVGQLLLSDERLVRLQAGHGFRPQNANLFRQVLTEAGVAVPPEVVNLVDPSPYAALDLLAAALNA